MPFLRLDGGLARLGLVPAAAVTSAKMVDRRSNAYALGAALARLADRAPAAAKVVADNAPAIASTVASKAPSVANRLTARSSPKVRAAARWAASQTARRAPAIARVLAENAPRLADGVQKRARRGRDERGSDGGR